MDRAELDSAFLGLGPAALDALQSPGPVLFPEVQVSRQYYFHVVLLPGDPKPTFHRWFEQAIGHIEQSGFTSWTMVTSETQYHLSLNP